MLDFLDIPILSLLRNTFFAVRRSSFASPVQITLDAHRHANAA